MLAAVVLTHNRPAELAACVQALAGQVDRLLVIDNASDPPAQVAAELLMVPDQPPNLAQLWQRGLDWAEGTEHVALVCDDVTVPAGWVGIVVAAMSRCGAAAGSTHAIQDPGHDTVKTAPDGDIFGRMCGAAFILARPSPVTPDPAMAWWWCDTDIDWQARHNGGTVIAAGPVAHNSLPNDWTQRRPELAEQAGRDRAAFAAKWSGCPW
jgi:hypothetical protein